VVRPIPAHGECSWSRVGNDGHSKLKAVAEEPVHVVVNTSNTEELSRLVYVSAAKAAFPAHALRELLEKARARNRGHDVTGMLLHEKGSFFQVLEGPTRSVAAIYERISRDTRHHRVAKLISETGVDRVFADWSMGYAEVSFRDLISVPGCNDFFGAGRCYAELSSGVAKNLLAAFRDGRFRAHIA
jgi:hypothetical protein